MMCRLSIIKFIICKIYANIFQRRTAIDMDRVPCHRITLHSDSSLSIEYAALAGLVEGNCTASIPVTG